MVYALVFLVLLGMLLNNISRKYLFYNLAFRREISKRVVEIGEEFSFSIIIENNKWLPVAFLQIEERLPPVIEYKYRAEFSTSAQYLYHKTTMFVMSRQRIKRTYKVSAGQRGRHVFDDVTLIAGDFLALESLFKNIEYRQEIVVLPGLLELDAHIEPYGNWYGDISVKRWIVDDPVLTVGIAEYTGSEPQKFIHWPSSLKTGRLMVKKFDYTTDNAVMIILNIECFKPFWLNIQGEKIEKCLSLARSVVEELDREGIPYGFAANFQAGDIYDGREGIPPGCGTAHYDNILETLARASYSISMDFEEMLENILTANAHFTTYVIITPAVLPPYVHYINALGKKSSKTVLISLDGQCLELIDRDISTYVGRKN